MTHYFAQHINNVLIAIGAWKRNYTKFHTTNLFNFGRLPRLVLLKKVKA